MSPVLAQPLRVGEAALLAVLTRPLHRLLEIFVDAVVAAQPFALGGMAAQHFVLLFQLLADVHVELRVDSFTEGPRSSQGIGVIECRVWRPI